VSLLQQLQCHPAFYRLSRTLGTCGIDFLISVRFWFGFLKKTYLVWNEFDSVPFKKTPFGSDIIVITTHVIANITVTVDDMTMTSLTSLTTTTTSK